jgi:hypothetical protein
VIPNGRLKLAAAKQKIVSIRDAPQDFYFHCRSTGMYRSNFDVQAFLRAVFAMCKQYPKYPNGLPSANQLNMASGTS